MCGDYIVLPHIYIVAHVFIQIVESNLKISISETDISSYMNK